MSTHYGPSDKTDKWDYEHPPYGRSQAVDALDAVRELQEVRREHLDPPYYQAAGYDLMDVIEAYEVPFTLGCAIKYLIRAGRKPGEGKLKDLKKAKRCIERAIENELIEAEPFKL